MKATFITLLALIASPALALVERDAAAAGGTLQFIGSLAGRAAKYNHGPPGGGGRFGGGGFQGGNGFRDDDDNAQGDRNPGPAAPAAPAFCKLSPSVLPAGAAGGAMPANLDGVCIAQNTCTGAGGQAIASGCSTGACCIKADCAGPNSNSACLQPDLSGDTLKPGQTGGFVNGQCPQGLRCFQMM